MDVLLEIVVVVVVVNEVDMHLDEEICIMVKEELCVVINHIPISKVPVYHP